VHHVGRYRDAKGEDHPPHEELGER
jgi:hypothetical protein